MIEQGTIEQRQLEAQISFLQLTLASLQARQTTGLDLEEASASLAKDAVLPGAEAPLLDIPLPIAAG
jgi:hypothetical protein